MVLQKATRNEVCTLKSPLSCNSIKALECLLVVVFFKNNNYRTKLYSAVHRVKKKTYLKCLRLTIWPFFPCFVYVNLLAFKGFIFSKPFESIFIKTKQKNDKKHRPSWRKWASAMHAEIPYTEKLQMIFSYCAQIDFKYQVITFTMSRTDVIPKVWAAIFPK